MYAEALRVADRLDEGPDYTIDAAAHSASLTQAGKVRCHAEAAREFAGGLQRSWGLYVEQALQARLLLKKDIDYVVADGKIVLVDGATGRLCPDRNWSEGLHQILEVKENLKHSGELRTAARITRQRYFRMYDMLCGMTGTAMESRGEFWRVFGLRSRQGAAQASAKTASLADAILRRCREQMAGRGRRNRPRAADGAARAHRLADHREQRNARQAAR